MANKQQQNRGFRAGAPILGLILAITLAVVAFAISIPLVSLLGDQFPDVGSELDGFRENYKDNEMVHDYIVEAIMAALIWFVLLGLAMLVASASMGTNPEKQVWKDMPPSPADKKAMIKLMKKDLREAKKGARAQKRQQKKG